MPEQIQVDRGGHSSEALYFAYGSNMSQGRLNNRIAGARRVGTAALARHQLRFHKISSVDGSGKCDACHTGLEQDQVLGVLYAIRKGDFKVLDRIEGAGHGYRRGTVTVDDGTGSPVQAETYFATRINPDLCPMDWYLEHVLHGARAAGLPESYIEDLVRVKAMRDTNTSRRAAELSLYG